MIKKLRIKMIAISMLAIFIVLGTIVTIINVLNYNKIVRDADNILNVLIENNGRFPDDMQSGKNDSNSPPGSERPSPEFPRRQDGFSPETPFESRYFSILVDTEGNYYANESMQIAAVNAEEAKTMATEVYSSGKTKGFYDNYRFVTGKTEGGTRIIFLDCMRSLDNFRNTLTSSIVISLIGLGAVFVLVLIFSKRMIKPVSESYDKQKEFITNAGHEIKTPLSIINADAEVLEMETGENEWVDDIKFQTKRLTELTNDLIYLARMDEARDNVKMLEFPLSDMVTEAASSFAAPAKAEHKSFSYDIEPGITFKGDEKEIYKLVTILLDNAMKYSPEGGYIHVELKQAKNRISLNVTNTTQEELDEASLEHFFDRFYRADKSRNSKKSSYGIGLSVARAIVDKHKGRIRAYAKDPLCIVIETVFNN